ncbi:MAG: iron-sulfur cluster biosynthesis family protein [Tissierellia bacterium]|nr:iron-sulfur cluster biosynthesis family protein [Tissierellia bacterium]MDD4725359.1 iron-sulfur cluster biosynthesis family protein [Tissierellia bacterium]
MNIQITEKAKTELDNLYGDSKDDKVLRISAKSYGCGGASFALNLDDPREDQEIIKVDGYGFVLESGVSGNYKNITIDYSDNVLKKGIKMVAK